MSRTTVLGIWPGEKYKILLELGNSWGSAPPVWGALAKEFLGMRNAYYPRPGWMENLDKVFDLYKDSRVPLSLRAVLMMTFDRAYVIEKNYERAAKDIRAFMEHYPNLDCSDEHPQIHGTTAFHWNTIAYLYEGKLNPTKVDDLLKFGSPPPCPAVGLWCTSVSPNPFANTWEEVEEEDGKFDDVEVPFDWSTAYDLYAELDSF
jgi:hypothetical protein